MEEGCFSTWEGKIMTDCIRDGRILGLHADYDRNAETIGAFWGVSCMVHMHKGASNVLYECR